MFNIISDFGFLISDFLKGSVVRGDLSTALHSPNKFGGVEKVDFLGFFPLCSLVFYFVILCGSINYV